MTDEQPTMRVTNIALDHEEMPREITVIMSGSIADRINQEIGTNGVTMPAGEPIGLSIYTAARIAKHFGNLTPSDAVTCEVWACLTGVVFNRFWDGGLDEYWAGRS